MGSSRKRFRLGDWTVEPGRLLIECGGEERHLDARAMDLLVYLADNAGQVVSRDALAAAPGTGSPASSDAVTRGISQLRSQLGDNPRKPRYIETVPGSGYRLTIQPGPADRNWDFTRRYSKRATGAIVLLVLAGMLLGMVYLLQPAPAESRGAAPFYLAVLPFRDHGIAPEHGYFGVGLTEELIDSLSRVPQLRVVARSSQLGSNVESMADGIDYYLDGSLASEGERLRLHAEIIDANSGIVLWSNNYLRSGGGAQALQRELTDQILSVLGRELGLAAQPSRQEEVDLEAYSAYLNGVFLSGLRGEQPLRAAIGAFTSALNLDPGFHKARVGLAHAQVLLPFYSDQSEVRAFAEATRQLDRLGGAAEAEAEAIRGFIAFRQWYWKAAERHFLYSLAIDPNLANTHAWYSQFLATVGRLEESLQHARMAYQLNEVSPVVNDRLATAHLWTNQDQLAREQFTTGAELGFNSLQNPGYLLLLLRERNYDQVRQALRALHPQADLSVLLNHLDSLAASGPQAELVAAVEQLVSSGQLLPRLEFGLWIMLAQWEQARATIEKYGESRKYLDLEFLFAREAAALRSQPLFDEITARLGLDGYWRTAGQPDLR